MTLKRVRAINPEARYASGDIRRRASAHHRRFVVAKAISSRIASRSSLMAYSIARANA